MNQRMENSLSNAYQKSLNDVKRDETAYGKSKNNVEEAGIQLLENISKDEQFMKHVNTSNATDEQVQLGKMASTYEDLVENKGMSKTEAFNIALRGGAGISFFGISDFSIGTEGSKTWANNEGATKNTGVNEQENITKNLTAMNSVVKGEGLNEATAISTTAGKNFSDRYSEMQDASKRIAHSREVAESLNRVQSEVKSQGGGSSQDMTEQVIEKTAQELGIDKNRVVKMLESGKNTSGHKLVKETADNVFNNIGLVLRNVSKSAELKALNRKIFNIFFINILCLR